jgi:hypothetical protein
MDADGTDQTPLLTGADESILVSSWTARGNKIVFGAKLAGGEDEIHTVNADGSGETFVDAGTGPDWSPNGTKIAYAKFDSFSGQYNVWVADPDGSGGEQLAPGASPHWAPSGDRILFETGFFPSPHAIPHPRWETLDGSEGHDFDAGLDAGAWQPVPAPAYPRPGGATPLRVPLVTAFEACTSPNSNHVPPLAFASCDPPVESSSILTTSSVGKGSGSARLDVVPGDPDTPADEADLLISAAATDVRCAGSPGCAAGADWPGYLILRTKMRITDRANGDGGLPATVQDLDFSWPVECSSTPDPDIGGSCSVSTAAEALIGNVAREGQRAVVSAFSVRLLDLGPDGAIDPGSALCPPTCGSGDEQPFLDQGLFAP